MSNLAQLQREWTEALEHGELNHAAVIAKQIHELRIATIHDRRSQTSRANLEAHIPKPISSHGTAVLTLRIPAPTMDQLRSDATRHGISVSGLIRQKLHELGYDMDGSESRDTPESTARCRVRQR